MKLQLLPARTGLLWVRQGFRIFFKQPLFLSALFVLFFMGLSLLSLLPLVGPLLALVLFPGLSWGFMAATAQIDQGQKPGLAVLWSGFAQAGAVRRSMLVLGLIYGLGFVAVMAVVSLIDGGAFASLYWGQQSLDVDLLRSSSFQMALWAACLLCVPLTFLFWHAPALVYWHGLSPGKSLFFSLVACVRNFAVLSVFTVVWLMVFMGLTGVLSLLAGLLGLMDVLTWLITPWMLCMSTVFLCTMYYSFRDTFVASTAPAAGAD